MLKTVLGRIKSATWSRDIRSSLLKQVMSVCDGKLYGQCEPAFRKVKWTP